MPSAPSTDVPTELTEALFGERPFYDGQAFTLGARSGTYSAGPAYPFEPKGVPPRASSTVAARHVGD